MTQSDDSTTTPVVPEQKENNNGKTKESRQPFPCKVYDMLEDAEGQGFDDIVSWNSTGNGFMVYNKEKFTNEIIPLYFNQTKYKSFQRQLSLYGFERITVGKNKGLRHHEKLQRGSRQLCREMKPIGYKPRGSELKEKEKANKKSSQNSIPENINTSTMMMSSHEDTKAAPTGIPTVISTNSLHKSIESTVYQRVTPESSPMKIPDVSSDEKSEASFDEDMGFFEGMTFYLMSPPTEPAVPIEYNPNPARILNSALPPSPAEGLSRIISEDVVSSSSCLPTHVPTVEGQLKKAWEIGFAVAMTMDTATVSPSLEPSAWSILDMPSVGI